MAKRSRSRSSGRSSTSNVSWRLGLVVLALLIVVGIIYGWDTALQMLGLATPRPNEIGGVAPPASQVEGDYYTIYFTEPSLYSSGTTSGGIETHLIDLINAAQTSIHLAVFEFNLQNVADALIAAHNRGVEVQIVYDDEHTEDDPQMTQMIGAGIPATPDQRGAFMHNKFFIFDSATVWLGSWNVTVNDTFRNNNNAIVIRSPELAQNYEAEFQEMFNGQFGPTSPANTPYPSFTIGDIRVESYFSPEDGVMPRLVDFARTAQSTLHFMAFSFTDDDLAGAMIDRASAGVEVLGIFEQRGANTEFSACPPMLNAGLDVRLDGNPRTFHHKVVIVDSAAVAIGSFNFSKNAAESNDENMIILYDPSAAALYEEEFNRRWAEALLPFGGQCLSE